MAKNDSFKLCQHGLVVATIYGVEPPQHEHADVARDRSLPATVLRPLPASPGAWFECLLLRKRPTDPATWGLPRRSPDFRRHEPTLAVGRLNCNGSPGECADQPRTLLGCD